MAFQLRKPSGGSALRGGDSLRAAAAGVGVTINVDRLLVGTGTSVAATDTAGQGATMSVLTPALGRAILQSAQSNIGTGQFITVTSPALGQAVLLNLSSQTVINAVGPRVGSAVPLTASIREVFDPTTALGNAIVLTADVTATGPPPPPSTLWEVRIYDLNASTPRLTFAPVADWSFGYVLNAPGSFEAKVPLTNAQALESNFRPGQREIKVYRNNDLVWGGYLWQTSVNVRDQEVHVVGEGYYSRLRKRFVMGDLIYENPGLPQEEIAWKLIKHTQDQSPITGSPGGWIGSTYGDLNMSEGANPYTTVRERDYCAAQHPNIADSIDELTQMDDGFDFCITPTPGLTSDKVFRTFSPRKNHTTAVQLTGANSMTLDYDIDASDTVTRMTTIGSGDCNPPDDDRTSINSIQNFGLLQDVLEVQFSDLAQVQAHGKEEIRNRNSARWQATVEFAEARGPAWGSFDIGDTVKVIANKGFASFSQDMRVLEMNVSLQPGIRESFTTVTLDSVIG